jgi:hypothetical protein
MPWDRTRPSPFLVEWSRDRVLTGSRVVVVGCGLGADAVLVGAYSGRWIAEFTRPSP